MSTATDSSPPEDTDDTPRPDLQVVRDADRSEPAEEPAAGEDTGTGESEEAGEAPLLDSNGDPVTPQAPLDVQLREIAVRYLHGLPGFGQRPASFAESIEYSQTGDWATSSNGAKRAVHGLATVITYVVTWPLVDLLGKARTKPGPFAVALLIAFVLAQVLLFDL